MRAVAGRSLVCGAGVCWERCWLAVGYSRGRFAGVRGAGRGPRGFERGLEAFAASEG